jgi:glutamine amidotransferase
MASRSNRVMIIDYGAGNLLSVERAFRFCGGEVEVSSDPAKILRADRLVLPGVGAFKKAMSALVENKLVEPILEFHSYQRPLLGICLGMQMLMETSEEFGVTNGLGLIAGAVRGIPHKTTSGEAQKIPHIGWKTLRVNQARGISNRLLEGLGASDALYFVHSFQALTQDPVKTVATSSYGGHELTAIIENGNTIGCQFHPEKSGKVGLKMVSNFLAS